MAAEAGCGRTPYGCAPQGSAARGARSSMEYASSFVCPFSSGLFGELRALGLVDFLTQPGLRQVPPPPSQEAVQLGAHAPPPAAPTIRGSTHPSLWAGAQGPTQVPGPTVQPDLPPSGEASCGGTSARHRPPGEAPRARTKHKGEWEASLQQRVGTGRPSAMACGLLKRLFSQAGHR